MYIIALRALKMDGGDLFLSNYSIQPTLAGWGTLEKKGSVPLSPFFPPIGYIHKSHVTLSVYFFFVADDDDGGGGGEGREK